MHGTNRRALRATVLLIVTIGLAVASLKTNADTGSCGGQTITLPFVDVPNTNVFFCSIAGAYFSGLTNGTDATHYSPSNIVSRDQMAAFITRTLDQSARRGSRRAALDQYWTPVSADDLQLTAFGAGGFSIVQFDGADLWISSPNGNTVSRVRASDGKLLGIWTGAVGATGVLVAKGRIFITGSTAPDGRLYEIDPSQPPGLVTTVTSALGGGALGIAFDGSRIWTQNTNSISIVTLNPVNVTTITLGFSEPRGILFDGNNIWVADAGDDSLKKLDSSGNLIQGVPVGANPTFPVFDGTNIWVPNPPMVTVVRIKDASDNPLVTPFVLANLTGNGLNLPGTACFDGERILVTNLNSVSLWKAADLTPLGSVPISSPETACSDGLNFWIARFDGQLARF